MSLIWAWHGFRCKNTAPPPNKWLIVAFVRTWQVLLDDGQELPFPSCPLDEGFNLMHTVLSLSHVLFEW